MPPPPPPKTSKDFVDNTGTTVTALVSDPSVCDALGGPALGEPAATPETQLMGPEVYDDTIDYV